MPPAHSLPNRLTTLALCGVAAAAVISPIPARAQEGDDTPVVGSSAYPRVFLDCQGRVPCDETHFRREILFVNWAQDREDSDVHVIVTSEDLGGGGRRIVLDFMGRGEMAELTDRLTYNESGTDVSAETRDGVTQTLRLGLMRYAVESGLGDLFNVAFASPEGLPAGGAGGESLTAAQADPWNHWTFRIGLSGNVDLRETAKDYELSPSLSAERITEDWKIALGLDASAERSSRELSDGREVRDDRDEWDLRTLIVRSMSDHLSFGFTLDGGSSVARNQDARVGFSPAIEYNYFPYSMSNRRQLIVQYSGGFQYSDYTEETIFNRTTEIRPQHQLEVQYDAQEAWGNAGIGVEYSQYLHDVSLYRAEIGGNLSLRITRGLDLTLFGSTSWVQDEIHIPLSNISDEDILLGRQNLPSSYRYTARISLGYRFGSPFTNIVNTRFGGGGQGFGGGGGFD